MDISKQISTEVDATNADFASVSAVAAQAAERLGGTPLLPNADGVIVLPAGVSLDDVEVVGRDLVIRLADGQVLVVPDGAVFVPQIEVDGVVVPPLNLAALLTGNEPQPAAGATQSSGGNFADPADPLQDAYGLGDLLPYTELAFPEPQQQEVLPGRLDREPDVQIQDGGPIGRDVIDNVSEVGLPGTRANGAVESPGSSAGNGADATTGTIFVTSPDGIEAITINGVVVTGTAGQQIVTPTGVLTLGSLADGQIGYTYTLTDNTSGDTTTDVFTVAITDPDGDVATARLTIEIADDTPTARDDTAEIFEGDADNSVTLDVDTNDTPGADGTGSRTFTSLTGTYGTIAVNADGTQTYTLSASGQAAINALPPGATLTDTFTYTLTDGDGDSDPATLVVTLRGTDDGVLITDLTPAAQGGDTSVDEDDLALGSDPAPKDSLTGTGTFTISAPDGVDDLTVGSFTVIANGVFQSGAGGTTPLGNTISFTGYDAATGTVSYSYTLLGSEAHASGNGENALFEDFAVTLTDVDGDVDAATLSVRIVDDLPSASADGPAGVVEDAASSVSGDVLSNDASGADAPGSFVAWSAGNVAEVADLNAYGTLTLNANGTWSYVLDNSRAATQALTAEDSRTYTLDYTMQDADGDVSPATLTITIQGADDNASVVTANATGPDNTVYEAGLSPNGSDAASSSETDTGSFTVSATDGIATVVIGGTTFTLAQVQAFATTNGVVDTGEGTLTLTGYTGTAKAGTTSYSYTLKATLDNDSKTGATDTGFDDTIGLTVNGIGGTTASDDLVVRIVDDLPGATAEASRNVAEGATVSGTFDFVGGADGASLSHINATAVSFDAGTGWSNWLDLGAGELRVKADGSYEFKADAVTASPVAAITGTFTVTDGDADTAPASFAFQITDANTPTPGSATAAVDDDGLAGGNAASTTGDLDANAGDNPADTSEATFTGTLGGSVGADGAGGNGFSFAGNTTGTVGLETVDYTVAGNVLTATVNAGPRDGTVLFTVAITDPATGAYKVTLLDNVLHAGGPNNEATDATAAISYTITDADGSPVTGNTLTITFDDDTPTASGNTAVQLDDDALSGGNAGGTGDVTPDTANLTGTLGHSFGADGAGSVALLASGTPPTGFSYELSSGNLLIKQGDTTVITVTVNAATGGYTVTQNAAIDHPAGLDENDLAFTIGYRVTDGDGDTVDGSLVINVDDDTPTVSSNTAVQLDDDALSGGNAGGTGDVTPDTANLTGTLGHSFGADGAGSVALLASGTPPTGFSYELSSGNLLIKQGDTTVITVTVNAATGGYTVTQNAAIDHPAGLDENDLAFTIGYRVTDGDGDTVDGSLVINVDDDTPTVSSNTAVQLDDDALSGGNAGGTGDVTPDTANLTGTLGHSFGADGAGSVALLASGTPPTGFSYELSSGNLLIKQGDTTVITVTVNAATGGYTVTQNAAIDHPAGLDENDLAFTIGYRVTDGDGDTVDGSLVINVDDDTPTVSSNTAVQLDDDALSGGNAGGTGDVTPDTANLTGTLGHSFGADGAGSVALLASGTPPTGFSYELSSGNLLIKQGDTTVITVTVNAATGGYTVTQNAAIDHPAGLDENDLAFTIGYRVTDGDGDTVDGSLVINVDDDTPTVSSNTAVQLDDDALSGGNAGGTGDVTPDTANLTGTLGHSFGADGAGSVALLASGTPPTGFSYELSSGNLLIKQGDTTVITVTVNAATGGYTVTQNAAIDHPAGLDENDLAFTIGYRVTDGDGDTVDGSLVINVDDDTPTVSSNTAVQLDDDALSGGNAGGTGDVTPDTANLTGTLGHSFGADGAGSVALLASGTPPTGFSYELSSGNLLIKQGDTTVITVTVNAATGGYTVTQNAAIDHPAGLDENDLAFTIGYRVTDGDGDTVDGSLVINVDDDTPTAVAPEWGVVANEIGTSPLIELDSDNNVANNYGADGAGLVRFSASLDNANSGLTHGGQIIWYSWENEGQTLIGETRVGNSAIGAQVQKVFEITLQPGASDDSYSIQMFAPVDSFVDLAFTEAAYDFVGGNETWAGFVPNDQVEGKAGDTPLDDGSKDLLLTPIGDGTAVNGNANSAGTSGPIAGQNIGQGEGMRLDFVEDLTGIPTAGDYNTLSEQTHDFDAHYEVNGVTLRFGDGTSVLTKASFKAFSFDLTIIDGDGAGDDNIPDLVAGTGTLVSVTSIAITYDGERELVMFDPAGPLTQTVTVGSAGGLADRSYTVTFVETAPGSDVWYAEVTGVYDKLVTISTFAETNYSALEILHLGPSTADADFAITGFSTAVMSTDPVFASLPIEIVDGDGDAVASTLELAFGKPPMLGSDGVDNLAGDAGDNLIYGGQGADVLSGGAGNDTLIGGAGADSLTGGSGRDAFVVAPSDLTGSNDDTVQDYSAAEGDTVNLVGLFDSMGASAPSAANVASMVKLFGTALYVDADGSGAGTTFVKVLNFSTAPTSVLVAYDTGAAPITVTPAASQPPIVIDLGSAGIDYMSLDAGVTVDYGAGAVSTAWVGPEDGLLARDTGSGVDFVFADDAPGARTDLEGLAKAFDTNDDGLLTSADAAWSQFGVWQDSNSDGAVDAGEFHSLDSLGISSIGLKSDGSDYLAANGDVLVHGTGSYTKVNGTTGSLADVSFRTAVRTAEISAAAVAAAGVAYSSVAAAAVAGLGEQNAAPATEQGQDALAPASLAPQVQDAAPVSQPAEASVEAQRGPVADSGSMASHGEDVGAALPGLADAGHDGGFASDGPTHGADVVSIQSVFDSGNGAGNDGGFVQAMEALLGTPAPAQAEAAVSELPVIQEALAEAAGESFVDHLIGQFAAADHPAGAVSGGEASDAIHAALNSMLAGLDLPQVTFEAISDVHAMEAIAAAA